MNIHPSTPTRRRGRTGIDAILADMVDHNLLPSETSTRPDKKACLRTYGMLRTFFNRALESADPIIEYKEMLSTEATFRQRLRALLSDPTRALPEEMVALLAELRAALEEMVALRSEGIFEVHVNEEADKVVKEEMGVEEPERVRQESVRKVPITMVQKVREQLKAEQEKVRALNVENNRLATELRRVTMEYEFLRQRTSGRGRYF